MPLLVIPPVTLSTPPKSVKVELAATTTPAALSVPPPNKPRPPVPLPLPPTRTVALLAFIVPPCKFTTLLLAELLAIKNEVPVMVEVPPVCTKVPAPAAPTIKLVDVTEPPLMLTVPEALLAAPI